MIAKFEMNYRLVDTGSWPIDTWGHSSQVEAVHMLID